MSSFVCPVVNGDNDRGATGRGGKEINKKSGERKKIGNRVKGQKTAEYTTEQRSKFGEAFLPFANQLESVERTRIDRKRRGKNVRNELVKITKIPKYNNNHHSRINDYNEKRDSNVQKICKKIKGLQIKDNDNREKLKWIGDVMTFSEEWPNNDKCKTLRIFNINLNGVTYHNQFLEWEMTVAFLMDMQVDVFGLTEINLDLNNGIVKDNFVQAAKHFDPYLRMAMSSSLQKVGDSPFKMGGTVTGTNGCWSGRLSRQGQDKLGRWSFMSLLGKNNIEVMFITVYVPRKPSTSGGGSTIYKQMEADLLQKKAQILDPRKELLSDLYDFMAFGFRKVTYGAEKGVELPKSIRCKP